VPLQQAGERAAGELAALIGVEDLRLAVLRDRLFNGVGACWRRPNNDQQVRMIPAEH